MGGPLFNSQMDQAIVQQNFETNSGVMYKLGSIEAQLQSINEKLDKKGDEQDAKIKALEAKVSRLDRWQAYVVGGAAVVSFLMAYLQRIIPWSNLF